MKSLGFLGTVSGVKPRSLRSRGLGLDLSLLHHGELLRQPWPFGAPAVGMGLRSSFLAEPWGAWDPFGARFGWRWIKTPYLTVDHGSNEPSPSDSSMFGMSSHQDLGLQVFSGPFS